MKKLVCFMIAIIISMSSVAIGQQFPPDHPYGSHITYTCTLTWVGEPIGQFELIKVTPVKGSAKVEEFYSCFKEIQFNSAWNTEDGEHSINDGDYGPMTLYGSLVQAERRQIGNNDDGKTCMYSVKSYEIKDGTLELKEGRVKCHVLP